MTDHIDLLVEQVKMLAGEIALGTSTLKRMVEQSVNDPDSSKVQVKFLFVVAKAYSALLFSEELIIVLLHTV